MQRPLQERCLAPQPQCLTYVLLRGSAHVFATDARKDLRVGRTLSHARLKYTDVKLVSGLAGSLARSSAVMRPTQRLKLDRGATCEPSDLHNPFQYCRCDLVVEGQMLRF